MRTRTLIWLAALPCAVLAIAVAVAGARPVDAGNSTRPKTEHKRGKGQERYLYVTTIAQSATDPDFIAVIGADPRRADFGKIVNRVDMPNVGDELHHFGYSRDQERLVVPGLFSNRSTSSTSDATERRWRSGRSTTSWPRRAATSCRTASWTWTASSSSP